MLQLEARSTRLLWFHPRGGYSASCPGLPGCWSQGATEEEALANIQDAIAEYLEVAKQLAGPQNLREVEVPA
jgi:predicted RNase H-like HicB family nuclease